MLNLLTRPAASAIRPHCQENLRPTMHRRAAEAIPAAAEQRAAEQRAAEQRAAERPAAEQPAAEVLAAVSAASRSDVVSIETNQRTTRHAWFAFFMNTLET